MAIAEKYIGAEEFFVIANGYEYENINVDLVDGEIIEIELPGGKHGQLTMHFALQIGNFVKQHQLGRVTAANTGFILSRKPDGRDTVRGIDIAFIRRERVPESLPETFVPFAPDLAVEVVSPNNTALEIHNKVLELLRAGTTLIWVAYYDSQTVVVHTPDGARTLTAQDTLDGGDVLPGFKIKVSEIFT